MKRLALALCVLFLAPASFGQTGYPEYGSFQSGPVDAVNLQNLNTVVSIPVIQTAGRGGTPFAFPLTYNSLQWVPSGGAWHPAPTGGWITSPASLLMGSVSSSSFSTNGTCGRCFDGECTGSVTQTTDSGYVYVDPAGTPHSFGTAIRVVITSSSCTGDTTFTGSWAGYSSDNLYYMNVGPPDDYPSPPVVWSTKTGIKMDFGNYIVTDTNGNQISRVYVNQNEWDWKDSAGRVAMRQIQNGLNIEYHYYDTGGNDQKFVLKYSSQKISTYFACSGLFEYDSGGTISWNLPSELDLPNGQSYAFSYEATPFHSGYTTGRLAKITLPTGGSVTYAFGGSNDGVSCSSGSVTNLARTVSDGTNSATWNFVGNGGSITTVTTPQLADTLQANDAVITFDGLGHEISRKIYPNSPGTGTPLRTINTTWATNGSPATQVTILDDGTTESEVDTTFDQYGLLDVVSQYDFGSGGRGPLIRTTNLTYNTSTNYANVNIRDLLISKQVTDNSGAVVYRQDTTYDGAALGNCPTGVAQHDDTDYPCGFSYRGNPTSVTTYLTPSGPSGPVTKNFTYDIFGNLLTAQLNCCQSKTWAYSRNTNYSEPDSVTSGTSPTLTTRATYYANGPMETSTDENNLVTNFSYDPSLRPTGVSQTNGESISYSYNDTSSPFTMTATTTIDASKSIQQITAVDGLGDPILSTTEDAGSKVYSNVGAKYDLLGRAYATSNPYNGGTLYWTTSQLDALGRPTTVTLPDNSASTASYTANTTTASDPTGKQRKSQVDGAGRLTSVSEPDPTNNNSLTLQTSYAYNVLDELTQVTQGAQTRSYAYDALGRLNSATTPEGGRVCYGTVSGGTCNANGYDNFDNLLYRTDARGVLTSYGYDGLNRINSVSYNVSGATGVPATASVGLTYGTNAAQFNNGRLITMTDGVGSENYSYNNLGQLTQLQKVIGTTTYTTGYAYNVANELTQITYPSGRIVQQSVDPIGRLCEIAPSTTGCSTASSWYATGFGYNTPSLNLTTGLKYGNGVYASFGFSPDRLQLTCLDYSTTNRNGTCTHDSTSMFGLSYSYGSAGSNNGQISSITDYMQSGRSATYTYDSLYRLTNAATTGSTSYPAWGLSETYDRYGNRWAQSIFSGCTQITCPTNSVTVSPTTNQITPSPEAYDLSGNMTYDGLNTITIDGEAYTVDPAGNRTAKTDYLASATSNYTYDKIYELTQVTGGNPESYSYDPVGNRLSSLGVSSYTNNTSNELTSTSNASYGYDSDGNQTSKTDSTGTTNYTWDFENRLTQATLPGTGGTESYRYDPFGRRIQKVFTQSGTGTTTNYLYDGDNAIETVDQNGSVLSRFAQDEGVDHPLAESTANGLDFYEEDGSGSVTSLTNSAGALAQTYTYDSFGKLTNSSGSVTNSFRYTGRDFDAETGLYYFRARYVDPTTGRFLSEDPLDFETGTNFYDYVANDPTTLIDPWGLWHCAANANCNFTPEFKKGLDCFQKCIGSTEVIITSGRRPASPKHPNNAHSRGEACDIGRNANPNLPLDKVVKCFLKCFPHGYGQQEQNQGPGTHFHFQLNVVPGGTPRFNPTVQPYNP